MHQSGIPHRGLCPATPQRHHLRREPVERTMYLLSSKRRQTGNCFHAFATNPQTLSRYCILLRPSSIDSAVSSFPPTVLRRDLRGYIICRPIHPTCPACLVNSNKKAEPPGPHQAPREGGDNARPRTVGCHRRQCIVQSIPIGALMSSIQLRHHLLLRQRRQVVDVQAAGCQHRAHVSGHKTLIQLGCDRQFCISRPCQ